MRNLIIAAFASLFIVNSAFATPCEDKAMDKNGKALAGAAKAASVKKCEKDAAALAAAALCADKAVSKEGKPLVGAAKAASVKKCEKDAAAK